VENRCSLDISIERDDYMCETELCSGELSPGEFDLALRQIIWVSYYIKNII